MLCNTQLRCYVRGLASLPVLLVVGMISWEWYGFTMLYYPRRHPYLFDSHQLFKGGLKVMASGALFTVAQILFCLLTWAYFAVAFTPPGYPSETWRRENEGATRGIGFCHSCATLQPPRSQHCCMCGHCVLKQDHHCPWVGNCVGFRNHKFFLQFLGFTWTTGLTVFLKMYLDPAELTPGNTHIRFPGAPIMDFAQAVVMAFGGVIGVSVIFMWVMHLFLICTNQTSPEIADVLDYVGGGNGLIHACLNTRYTLGSYKSNWKATMGPTVTHWIFPTNPFTYDPERDTHVLTVEVEPSSIDDENFSSPVCLDGETWPQRTDEYEAEGLLGAVSDSDSDPDDNTSLIKVQVKVPPGMKAGDQAVITCPSGNQFITVIPTGYESGQFFTCDVPS